MGGVLNRVMSEDYNMAFETGWLAGYLAAAYINNQDNKKEGIKERFNYIMDLIPEAQLEKVALKLAEEGKIKDVKVEKVKRKRKRKKKQK